MNEKINDGGPVYPKPAYLDGPDGKGAQLIVMETDGISLRDWFAGMAMQGIHASYSEGYPDPDNTAEIAYAQADALLAERNRKNV